MLSTRSIPEIYLGRTRRVMNCWGWATWADRWAHFEKNPHGLIDNWSAEQKHYFDLDSSGVFWHQVTANAEGKMNTWAIFWYATLYEKGGLCLNPSHSYVDNIGHDGSGVHCGNAQTLTTTKPALCNKTQLNWPANIAESSVAIERLKKQLNQNLFQKIWKRVCKLISGD